MKTLFHNTCMGAIISLVFIFIFYFFIPIIDDILVNFNFLIGVLL